MKKLLTLLSSAMIFQGCSTIPVPVEEPKNVNPEQLKKLCKGKKVCSYSVDDKGNLLDENMKPIKFDE